VTCTGTRPPAKCSTSLLLATMLTIVFCECKPLSVCYQTTSIIVTWYNIYVVILELARSFVKLGNNTLLSTSVYCFRFDTWVYSQWMMCLGSENCVWEVSTKASVQKQAMAKCRPIRHCQALVWDLHGRQMKNLNLSGDRSNRFMRGSRQVTDSTLRADMSTWSFIKTRLRAADYIQCHSKNLSSPKTS
jgi:hypothetical protein